MGSAFGKTKVQEDMDNKALRTGDAWSTFNVTLRHTQERHTSVTDKTFDFTRFIDPVKMQYVMSHHQTHLQNFLEKHSYNDIELLPQCLRLSVTSTNSIEDLSVKVVNELIYFLLDYDVIPIVMTKGNFEVQLNSKDRLDHICLSYNVNLLWRQRQVYLAGSKNKITACYDKIYSEIYKGKDHYRPDISKLNRTGVSNVSHERPDVSSELGKQSPDVQHNQSKRETQLSEENKTLTTQITSLKQEFGRKMADLERENVRLKSRVAELQNQDVTKELAQERQQNAQLREQLAALEAELSPNKQMFSNQFSTKSDPAQKHEICPICLDEVTDAKTLKCGHLFCSDCINESFQNYKRCCPTCGDVQRVITGDQPTGTMKVQKSSTSIEGFEGHGTITIRYEFPDGQQGEDHPEPGRPYEGKSITSFLPDTEKGNLVLNLLRIAFDRKLIFTIGTEPGSEDDVITWNKIRHKTNMEGGPESGGYPDRNYLDQVLSDLRSNGITEEDIGTNNDQT